MAKLVVNETFKTEADEARWWAKNQDLIAQKFDEAAADGSLGRGTVAKKGLTPTTTIRLSTEDIARARVMAERKGLRYQTYLKMLIHEALGQEEAAAKK
jgi:predicted DNA binding CopG/RHH family protein